MKLLELSYKNLLSYGNRLQTFTFGEEPQLILIEGENGAGKSSIKEALTVSLYGRSAIRKMKDIPNWINRNAYTNIKFATTAGDLIEIDRGIDPNFSDIKINGAHFNLPDKRKVDEFVEDELLKIPFPVFCNTISLSFDDFKSFVNLSQADKRKIVDRIFGIDVITDMRNVVKEELKQSKKGLELINSQISINENSLETSIKQLDSLKERLSKKKESQTSDLEKQISEQKEKLESTKTEYAGFKTKIDDLQKEINSVREKIIKSKSSISELDEKLNLYKKNRCPHCLNDLTSEASIKTKEAIENKKSVISISLPGLNDSFKAFNSELEKLTNSQNLAKSEYYKISAEVEQLQKDLKKISSELASDETSSIEAIISTIEDDLQAAREEFSTKKEEVDLCSTLDELLSDSGIKKNLIDKIIPTLNGRILDISQRLEFKFSFEFDSDFNPIITYLGMEVSPESLSSGQRKKMNLIVLLAFIEIIKMKHNSMNVLFLDEIFSSLDKNNVYRAIEILREYANQYGMTVFVVSHESLPEEFFDQKILVKSVNHFSEMSISKIGKTA